MFSFVNTSSTTTSPSSAVSNHCTEVVASDNSQRRCDSAAEEGNGLGVPNVSAQTSLSSVGLGADAAGRSHIADVAESESIAVDVSAIDYVSSRDPFLERLNESIGDTPGADELGGSDSTIKPLLEADSIHHCRSAVVTFNLPLEVIGACWFMKRDTETCLQAATANDGLFVILCVVVCCYAISL